MNLSSRLFAAAAAALLAACAASPEPDPKPAGEATPAAASKPKPTFLELYNGAKADHAAKNYDAMQKKLEAALELRPAHPAALYNLARALALKGEKKQALEHLETLAYSGLSYDPAADPDFASLKGRERFDDVNKRFERNRRPVGRASQVFTVGIPTFIPEGLAWDESSDTYFIGSVHERRIQKVPPGKSQQDFIQPGAGGLWAAMGMAADERRRMLWVATAALPEMKGYKAEDAGKSAILGFDLDSGEPKKRFVLDDGKPHLLGDVVVVRKDALYATDSKGGVLYRIDVETGKFEAMTQPGELASPQGMAVSEDGWYLYVADYTQGLFRFDLSRRTLRRMDVARDISVYGIDGLYRWENTLVAVQNGIQPHRVVQFGLSRDGRRVTGAYVLAANLKEFDEPALGAVVDEHFAFIANSQWGKFSATHELPPASELRGPIVLRTRLERSERSDDPRRLDEPRPAPAQQGGGLPLPLPLPR